MWRARRATAAGVFSWPASSETGNFLDCGVRGQNMVGSGGLCDGKSFGDDVSIAYPDLFGAPMEIAAPRHKESAEGVEQRHAGKMLNEKELAHFVDLQKDVVSLGRHDEIETSENNSKRPHELPAALCDTGGELVWLHLQFIVGFSPIQLTSYSFLGPYFGCKGSVSNKGHPQLVCLRDDRLEDSGSCAKKLVGNQIFLGDLACIGQPVCLLILPSRRVKRLIDHFVVVPAKELSDRAGIIRIKRLGNPKTCSERQFVLKDLSTSAQCRFRAVHPERAR